MFELTGLWAFDWYLLGIYALGATLLLGSRRRHPGSRVLGVLVVGAAAGSAIIVGTAALQGGTTVDAFSRLGDRAFGIFVLAAVLVLAFATIDFLFLRVIGPLAAFAERRRWTNRPHDTVTAVILTGLVVAVFGSIPAIDPRLDSDPTPVTAAPKTTLTTSADDRSAETSQDDEEDGQDAPPAAEGVDDAFQLLQSHELPGRPLEMALQDARSGYLSLADGSIVRFELHDTTTARLAVSTEVDGLLRPRGVAVADGRLLVAELGELPCAPDSFRCKGEDVPGESSKIEAEARILSESRARILAYDISPDGTLGNRQVLVEELPVANTEHAVNGLTAGPDGAVYAAIGNIDRLWEAPQVLAEVEHPNKHLLGTVVRIDPSTGSLDVVAEGLRNVYGLAVDEHGNVWGVDNDGFTLNGFRREELLHIEAGEHYGFPVDPSEPPFEVRTRSATWLFGSEVTGSAGMTWVDASDDRSLLLTGNCGSVRQVLLTRYADTWRVQRKSDVRRVLDTHGCVTALGAKDNGRVLLTVLQSQRLHVLARNG